MQADMQADMHADMNAGIYAGRHAGRHASRHECRHAGGHACSHACIHESRHACRHAGMQADMHADRQTCNIIYAQIIDTDTDQCRNLIINLRFITSFITTIKSIRTCQALVTLANHTWSIPGICEASILYAKQDLVKYN